MHVIENESLRVKAREYGAELISIFDKKNNIEHLWQANPEFWGWHAPVLFPAIGRSISDEVLVDSKKYKMEKHGFARKSNFKLLELSETKMVFELVASEETLKWYPFKFEFLIAYRLKENELICSFEVINEDEKPLYFQLGGHPAFNVPFFANEDFEDYYIAFEQNEELFRHHINEEGFFDGRKTFFLDNANCFALEKELFNDDALIFKDLKSRSVAIKSGNHQHAVEMNFEGFPYFGIWTKPGAPYVCLEPWMGCADSVGEPVEMSAKEKIIALEPGEEFNPHYTIRIL
jgi:galactose mutarotase-like enzyme